ncbi:MAG: hypothetical protein AAB974_02390 [Patescibacteria group bacterium]
MAENQFEGDRVRVRGARKGHDRSSIVPQKESRKAARDRVMSEELHARIIGVLQLLIGRGDIKSFAERDRRPANPQLTVVFTVTRPGKVEPIERNFFVIYNPRLCGMIPAKAHCAPILATREMHDERIAERILALFQN